MLHLTIAANLLTAVGGKPDYVHAVPPAYPTQLPTHIHEGLSCRPCAAVG
jgi:Ferritin-like